MNSREHKIMAVVEVRTLLAGLSFILSLWLLVARPENGRGQPEGGHKGLWRPQVGEKGSILPVDDETGGLFSVEEDDRSRISVEEDKSVEKGMQFLRNTGTEEIYRVKRWNRTKQPLRGERLQFFVIIDRARVNSSRVGGANSCAPATIVLNCSRGK